MPSFPDLHEPLVGPEAHLRLVAERDIPEMLIAHQDDPQMYAALGQERPPSGAELGRRIERGPAERAAGAGMWLTILEPGWDECAGALDAHDIDWDHSRAELGIWIAPQRRRRGLATGALRLAARWLLTSCGLHRVGLLTDPHNVGMSRAAVSAGFTEEGVLRAYQRERRGRVDVVCFSLIAEDLSR